MAGSRLPIHLAAHYLTCATEVGGSFGMNHDAGRVIERLAERVERVSVLAYDPPCVPRSDEDLTPYVFTPRFGNVRLVSLGPKGTWRQYLSRRRRVHAIVLEESRGWDVLLLRLVNRRAHLVSKPSRCSRLITQVGGSMRQLRTGVPIAAGGRLASFALSLWEESHQRRIIAESDLTFVVGEDLKARYDAVAKSVVVLRESGLRDEQLYLAPDRLLRPDTWFVIAGQINHTKGAVDAVHAFARIKARVLPDAELHVVGTGDALDQVQQSASDLGVGAAVQFHGWIGDERALFELFRRMDVLFCLSRVDFLPRVVWEAMGSGVLVIATPVGALPAVFRDQEDLLFVPIGDVAAVEVAVQELIRRPELRRNILKQAFGRAREATIERMVDGLLTNVTRRWPEVLTVGSQASEEGP